MGRAAAPLLQPHWLRFASLGRELVDVPSFPSLQRVILTDEQLGLTHAVLILLSSPFASLRFVVLNVVSLLAAELHLRGHLPASPPPPCARSSRQRTLPP
jgi:hypothetical protein